MAPPVKSPAPPQGPKAVVTCPTVWLVNRQPASNLPGGSGGGCTGCTTVTTNAAVSANPVRYWDGSIYQTEPDIVTPYGGLFSHIRRYNNRTANDFAGPNGINWFIPQMPYMYVSGSDFAVVYDPNNPFWFAKPSTTYNPQYGVLDVTLTDDGTYYSFTRNTAGGTEVTRFDMTDGSFYDHTDAAGVVTSAAYSGTPSLLTELTRDLSDGTTTTTESLLYTYNTDNYIDTVTYRRSTNGGSSWTLIKKMVYTYHDGTDSFGSAGDLKTASSQNYNTGTSAWETVAVCYYRYYTTGNFLHGLQYHIGPEGYRLAFNDGVDVTTDTDANIAPYADHHFVYDSTRRVTKETAAVCIGCPGGGTTEDDFAYTARSSGTPGLNSWGTKTVQTLPNGATITVYSDEIGMPLCEIYADGTDTWAKAWQYDSNRSVVQMAEASAIDTSKITDTQDDLVDWDNSTGTSAIRASTGLVRVTDYYGSTGGGAVAGYVEFEKVQQGRTGTPVKLRFYQYTSNTAGGNTIYLPSRVRVYPLSTTTLVYDDTDYSYTFQTGSTCSPAGPPISHTSTRARTATATATRSSRPSTPSAT